MAAAWHTSGFIMMAVVVMVPLQSSNESNIDDSVSRTNHDRVVTDVVGIICNRFCGGGGGGGT